MRVPLRTPAAKALGGGGRKGTMTLILACLTERAVYLLSDRRLVDGADPQRVIDDESNKVVVAEGRVVFGYSGLAMIGRERTAAWLARVIGDGPTRDWAQVSVRINDRATADFQKLSHRPELKRHAFMGVGWFLLRDSPDEFRPGIVVTDNAVDHATGDWLDRPLAGFHTGVQFPFPAKLPGGLLIDSIGIRLSPQEEHAVFRLVRRCVKRRDSTLRSVEQGLIIALRWLSSRHPEIGPNLMSVYIPKAAVERADMTGEVLWLGSRDSDLMLCLTGTAVERVDMTGEVSLLGGPPHDSAYYISCSYISATDSRTFFYPNVVGGGAVFTDLKVEYPRNGPPTSSPEVAIGEKKLGRNDACPCGSGKKYKKCHGA